VDITSWSPIVGLGGVALGAVGTWITQWLTRRQTSALSIAAQKAALREDRRKAIDNFLESVQVVDEIADAKYHGAHLDVGEGRRAVHDMWFRQKCLDVVASKELCSVTLIFAERMASAVWDGCPPAYKTIFAYMTEERDKFLRAAKAELYNANIYER